MAALRQGANARLLTHLGTMFEPHDWFWSLKNVYFVRDCFTTEALGVTHSFEINNFRS